MLRRVLYGLIAVALFAGCGDDNNAVAPEPPPQITVQNRWVQQFDGAGRETSLQSNDVYDFLVTSEGEVWMGTEAGISIYEENSASGAGATRVRFYTNTNGLPNPKVRRMIEYNGEIYVATWGGGVGVYAMADSSWTKLPLKNGSNPGLLSALVNDIEEISGFLYFATNGGVSIYNPIAGTFTDYAKAQGLSYPTYHNKNCPDCPLKPIVSSIGSGTTSRGLEKWYGPRVDFGLVPSKQILYGVTVVLPGSKIVYKVNPNGLPELTVNDIFFDTDTGHFWLAFPSKGLAEVNVDTGVWTRYTAIQGLPSNSIYSITKVNGRLWVGTQNGLAAQRDDGRWQGYGRGASLKEVRIRRVYSDDGVRLWAGTITGGAMLINPNSAEGI